MPSLKGTILITGANGGLGTGFVSNLLASPYASSYRGVYTVRDARTASALKKVLDGSNKRHQHDIIALDLSSLTKVREAAAEINAKVSSGEWAPIRALILNGAWQEASQETKEPRTFTHDGFEGHFGINYLANFLLVLLLLKSMDRERGRIVMVSSMSHDTSHSGNEGIAIYEGDEYKVLWREPGVLARGLVYADDGYKAGMRRYGTSKLLLVMFMFELQRRLSVDPALDKICVLSLDPGAMGGTGLLKRSPLFIRFLTGVLLYSLQGVVVLLKPNGIARTTKKSGHDLLLASFDEEYLGKYPKAVYLNGSEKSSASEEAQDEEKQRQLWVESVKLAKIQQCDTILKDL